MYAEIQKQTDKHSVSELCEIYGVSRSGYYKWLKRAGRLNRHEKAHEILDRYVLDSHSHYRQIWDKLCLEFGWIVSDPTIWKSMKRLGIHGYTWRRKQYGTYPIWQCLAGFLDLFNNERPVPQAKRKTTSPVQNWWSKKFVSTNY